jgi:hypothetical protein
MRKSYICSCCGGKDLSFDASGKWNEAKQEFEFELSSFYFIEENLTYCNVCDNWVDFKETEIE